MNARASPACARRVAAAHGGSAVARRSVSFRRVQCHWKPTSRQVRASSRKPFTSGSSVKKPSRLPRWWMRSSSGVQSAPSTAATTSSIDRWPKCRYGLRPLACPSAGRRRLRARLRVAVQARLRRTPRAARGPRSRRRRCPRPARPSRRPAAPRRTRRGRPPATARTADRRAPRAESAGSAAARCAHASANALWMRGRRCAAAYTAGCRSDERHDAVRVHREDGHAHACRAAPRSVRAR